MTENLELHDWRLLERIVGLTSRLGCGLTRVDLRAAEIAGSGRAGYRAEIEFTGAPDSLRRLKAQLARLINDDKEFAR